MNFKENREELGDFDLDAIYKFFAFNFLRQSTNICGKTFGSLINFEIKGNKNMKLIIDLMKKFGGKGIYILKCIIFYLEKEKDCFL